MHSVLIVDDEPNFRKMLLYALEPLALEIEVAENGLQGYQKIQQKEYDVVLMDIHMPIMAGWEALEKIRALRPNQKVILFSSGVNPIHLSGPEIQKQGVVACLHKPVELIEVEKALEQALGSLPRRLAK